MPTGVLGPPGLAAGRVAASRPVILATFAPPGAAEIEYVPYFGYDDQGWTRAPFERRPGETVTALGVRDNTQHLFIGTSNGRVLRRQPWSVPATWEEVYAAPPETFQPAVTGFAFDGDDVFVSLKGVLRSSTGFRFTDWTAGLGDLDPAIERRGRFGTTTPAPIGDRLLVSIGGLLPGATGTWAREPDGRWARTELPGDHDFAVVGGMVVAIREVASDYPAASVSHDQGRSWVDARTGAPSGGFSDVSRSNLGAIGFTSSGLFRLRDDLVWERLAHIKTDRSGFAVSGRDVFVPHVTGLLRFRIERPLPAGATFCGVEQTRQGRAPYVADEAIRECLWQAYQTGATARFISYAYTIEGGPVVRTVTVAEGRIRVALDSQDGFGFVGDVEFACKSLIRTAPSLEATGCSGGPWDRLHF